MNTEKIVRETLQQLKDFKDLPPGLTYRKDFAGILDEVSEQKGSHLLTLSSNGLQLVDRIFLEKFLLTAAKQGGQSWTVYFRSSDVSETSSGPTSGAKPIVGIKKVFLVASGKGGVGKTTMSAAMAKELQKQGLKVGLLDADIQGPSLGHMIHVHQPSGVKGKKLVPAITQEGIKLVSFTYLVEAGQPIIWRGPMLNKALSQLLFDVEWGELDAMIIDLPPGTGDTQMSLMELVRVEGAYLVITPHQLAVEDASRAAMMFKQYNVPILGLIENMSYFTCDSCDKKHELFGKSAAKGFAEKHGIKDVFQVPMHEGDFPVIPDFQLS